MDKKVRVKSLVSNRVILSAPELRLKRVWEKKGAVNIIPFEQLEEAIYNPGVEGLFTNGYLTIEDMEIKIALGLEPEGATEPVNIIALDDEQRKRYLTSMPIFEFKEKVAELAPAQRMELARYAIEHEIMDYDKSEVLEKYTEVDIMSAIKLNRDDEAGKER